MYDIEVARNLASKVIDYFIRFAAYTVWCFSKWAHRDERRQTAGGSGVDNHDELSNDDRLAVSGTAGRHGCQSSHQAACQTRVDLQFDESVRGDLKGG